MLKLLESLLSNDKVNRLREIVNKFRLNQRVNEIQRNFLKRLMMSRAGLVAVAFKTIQTLPRNLDIVRPNQFQQGLEKLVQNVLKKTFAAFRSDFEEGQALKKRAVIQLINTTASGQKKMYNRWANLTRKHQLLQ